MPLTRKGEGKRKALGKCLLLEKEQIEVPLIPQAKLHVLTSASDTGWHKAGCGLYSNYGKGRKNIVWGRRGVVGQGRLLNEFHTFHFWHSHSPRHLLCPCPGHQHHLERGTLGAVGTARAQMDVLECPRETKSTLLFFSACKQSQSTCPLRAAWASKPPQVGVDGPFLGGCQQKLRCDSLVPTPGGRRDIGVCLDSVFSKPTLRHSYSLSCQDPREGNP